VLRCRYITCLSYSFQFTVGSDERFVVNRDLNTFRNIAFVFRIYCGEQRSVGHASGQGQRGHVKWRDIGLWVEVVFRLGGFGVA
jgi:hypothetical protein